MREAELRQIKDLLKDLERLKKQLQSVELKTTSDSVTGSSPFYPYIQHTIIICGIDDTDFRAHVKQLREDLKDKIKEITHKVAQAQAYISTVPDADTRTVLQCRYINGMTWEQIERDMHISMTTAKRKFREWRDK